MNIISFFKAFFKKTLYQPFFNILILLYIYLPGHDFGIAIICLTILIRLALYPLMAQAIKSQKIMSQLQPKIGEIQKKYKDDKERATKEMLELYKKEKINPFGMFVPILIQFPILVALYKVFLNGFRSDYLAAYLYKFIPNPGQINPLFLGMMDLTKPNYILAILCGISQFIQSKMMISSKKSSPNKNRLAETFEKQSLFMFPAFTILILWALPSAVGLYWLTTTLFSIGQQYLILKKQPKTT